MVGFFISFLSKNELTMSQSPAFSPLAFYHTGAPSLKAWGFLKKASILVDKPPIQGIPNPLPAPLFEITHLTKVITPAYIWLCC